MKLSKYAEQLGIHYMTAYNYFKKGQIEGAYQLPSGTIIVPDQTISVEPDNAEEKFAIYARVSSSQNKENLESQSQRLIDFCSAKGMIVESVIKEVGSGVNDNRPKLQKLLQSDCNIIVEHKDRLTRFGFNYLEVLLAMQGRKIIVINKADGDKQDLMEDLVAIITSFTARYYGQRRSKRKTEKLIEELSNDC